MFWCLFCPNLDRYPGGFSAAIGIQSQMPSIVAKNCLWERAAFDGYLRYGGTSYFESLSV